MYKILHVVGARPNFPKIAPIIAAMARLPQQFQQRLVHTGQHYDERMSAIFFRDLALPQPDIYLGVGSGSHAQQTAKIMLAFEEVLLSEQPDWVIVVGDVNSTLACALVCAKLGVKLAHVEAGLRSFDRSMPEEINRLVTDQLADLLFTPSPDADEQLLREGIPPERIRFVGNVMIDSLVAALPLAEHSPILGDLGLRAGAYGLVTLHRPSNVDDPATLSGIVAALQTLARELPLVFPVHPRSRQRMLDFGLAAADPRLLLIEPQGYLDFLHLTCHARLVLTDSGGLQEESSFLGVPCLTLRPNTERPITVTLGTNRVIGSQPETIVAQARERLRQPMPPKPAIPGWDGHAAERIVAALMQLHDSSHDLS
jgi:UDP-N-acetylglucosamine 2-epimerase (non-hydrolysing)